jgi:glycosyltransferase involved in cell wall biosynthesis
MLSVGYFGHPPNVDAAYWFASRVLPLIRVAIPDARVRMVGAGTEEVASLAEYDGVELAGYVEDLDPEMAACAFALAPIREGGGLRTKVLESFAYGRTMVVTPIATAGIQAHDGVQIRVAIGARRFAEACIELLRDHDLRRRMEVASRALVLEHYTDQKMARRAEAIYRELIG